MIVRVDIVDQDVTFEKEGRGEDDASKQVIVTKAFVTAVQCSWFLLFRTQTAIRATLRPYKSIVRHTYNLHIHRE